ncbi:MAG: hypothetical protein UX58_C0003G0138 [Candidatus Wolfebacteria bacterium GW2011_GWB2_46_69]|uniref:Uncharacterized protein n=1 Tax=Candidatus Wolfebacteria bacterium GW2011_GWA2_47_9b TaxID=1619005 RepID=A0A0G1U6N1_9BACT|nr:MAG: hypothetical protein UX58_C0003G0138 [Candidatus Wolfebacteria bacterium GW2011_GWB2_46_69]KKU53834.1 MAG: hypothetical protein UX76_C0009G0024 [Candidatus Wolfebacteria bacterium GW2011_GWC1_47_103]KKU89781.1 MAG: hypothetical protein UY19_C0009G0030 [Candidatus Wolfebacteria bacterium GW2011_GWA2_47_9b]
MSRISLVTAWDRVIYADPSATLYVVLRVGTSKNEDTWYVVLDESCSQIRYNSESARGGRGVVDWMISHA